MIKSNISDKFLNKGLILNFKSKKLNYKSKKFSRELKSIFKKYGLIIFRDSKINVKNLLDFTKIYTKIYAQDAIRRKKRFNEQNIRDVDKGLQKIDLHSEASFTTACPDIITFYCKKPSRKSGATLICDGINLWKNLNQKTRDYFLFNPITYEVKASIDIKKNLYDKKWPMNIIGYGEGKISFKNSYIKYKLKKFAINPTNIQNELSFANHLFVTLKSEKQLISRKCNEKKIPNNILKEVKKISNELTEKIYLKKNDILLIDNKRFMHGRTKILKTEKNRDILIVQSLKSKF